MSNVTEKDIRDLIAKYPNPKGSCLNSFAYHIPMTQRNLEIIGKMSKYMGTLNKKYRGPRHGNRDWCDSLPKAYAEKVSLYARNPLKFKAWKEGRPFVKVVQENANRQAEEFQDLYWKMAQKNTAKWSLARKALFALTGNTKWAHGVAVITEEVHGQIVLALNEIIDNR